ncbi:MAG: hypothetical protein LBB18_04580 [Puniceicoccales bacterium]|jgi:hypothetical protein|nr:hypothetical protein [Puniceicoccales bacterium]
MKKLLLLVTIAAVGVGHGSKELRSGLSVEDDASTTMTTLEQSGKVTVSPGDLEPGDARYALSVIANGEIITSVKKLKNLKEIDVLSKITIANDSYSNVRVEFSNGSIEEMEELTINNQTDQQLVVINGTIFKLRPNTELEMRKGTFGELYTQKTGHPRGLIEK